MNAKLKPITDEIAELWALDARGLARRYEELFGRKPRIKHRQMLFRRCAWKVQEARYGGLSKRALERIDELLGEMDLALGGKRQEQTVRAHVAREPGIGATLTRTWKGREVRATRVEGGWECDGVVHRSLTAVVAAVTGTHASGRAWFNLTKRIRK